MPIPIPISISTKIDNFNNGIFVLFKSNWIENYFLHADADFQDSELFSDGIPIPIPIPISSKKARISIPISITSEIADSDFDSDSE